MHHHIKLLAAAAPLLMAACTANAQSVKDLVGTWTAISNDLIRQDGTKVPLFGPKGTGTAIFVSNGRYVLINVNPDVPKFGSGNRARGTDAENKASVEGSIAHYGTYEFDAAARAIMFKIEGSSFPNWRGETQVRKIINFEGDDLKWSVQASVGGTAEVGWKRVK